MNAIGRIALTLLIMGLFSFLGCSKAKSPAGSRPTEQKVSSLSPADNERLARQRAVVERYLGDDDSRSKYKTTAGKLGTLRALLAQQKFKPSQTYELQCMGVVLGDAFVQELGMEWVMVRDEHGSDPAVRLLGTTIIIFPLTMISKRIERGESVDVFDLFNGIADQVEQLKQKTK